MKRVPRSRIVYRALFLFGAIALLLAVLAGRFLYVQIGKEVGGVDLVALAEERWTSEQPLHGEKGSIFASNGEPIAEEVTSYTAYAIIDENYDGRVQDSEETARVLAPVIDMEESRLLEILNSDRFQVELGAGARQLTYEEMEEIAALDLKGIYFRQEPKRYYPNQVFASHVIGYVDRGLNQAVMGLEAGLDDVLSGQEGSLSYQRARNGIPLSSQEENIQEAYHGNNVHLTLNTNIQIAVEQALGQAEEEYSSERMMAVVADAETGAILAMSNRPTFNPNHYEDITNYTNFAVSDHFEPGSTLKMFTVAAAIEEGVYNGSETFQSGQYNTEIGNAIISDHNQGEGWGEIPFDEALLRSSNTGMARLVNDKLGYQTFYQYLERFGFGSTTGIGLPQEAEGMMAESELDAMYTAFGQSSAVTPIQQVQAATAIANDGQMMQPYIIDRVENPNTEEVESENAPTIVGEPISAETAEEVRRQLGEAVYHEYGTGAGFQVDGVEVAGKTGTAQIPGEDGNYLSGRNQNLFSFLGMAPKDDPEVIVYVAVDRPEMPENESGNRAVAKVFNTVMQQSMQYMNLTEGNDEPSEAFEASGIELVDSTGNRTSGAVQMLEEQGVTPYVLGDGGRIEAQYPSPGSKALAGEKVFLMSGDSWEMPDLTGWSARDVMKFSTAANVNIHHIGNGYAYDQSVTPGTKVSALDYVTVAFSLDQEGGEERETSVENESEAENENEEAEQTNE